MNPLPFFQEAHHNSYSFGCSSFIGNIFILFHKPSSDIKLSINSTFNYLFFKKKCKNIKMIENIVAYIYSITGLIFFIAWQMNYSLTKYFLKEKNFGKTLYLELFFLIIVITSYYLTGSVFFILLFIIHAANVFTIVFLKDQILDSYEIFDSQIMEITTIGFYIIVGFLLIFLA